MKTGRKAMNLAGQRYGTLTVVAPAETRGRFSGTLWLCTCDCGNQRTVRTGNLRSGHTISCGCYSRALLLKLRTTHGHARGAHSPEYRTWIAMHNRCERPKEKYYHNYGGRGIRVCERWARFENFLADMGPRPSMKHSIDRIDNDGPYSPENCRWATPAEQSRNTRTNIYVLVDGRRMILTDAAKALGIHKSTARSRLANGKLQRA